MTELFDISDEVFFYHIWPKCGFNDLLRMRRASSSGLLSVNNYLRSHSERIPELEINESGDKNVHRFLEMKLPVRKVFINNAHSGVNFFEEWSRSLDAFLDLHSSKITHLRLDKLSIIPAYWECRFLERLVNLESFTVRKWIKVGITTPDLYLLKYAHEAGDLLNMFPSVFKQLKNLEISLEDVWQHPNPIRNILNVVCDGLFKFIPYSLERIALPMVPFDQDLDHVVDAARAFDIPVDQFDPEDFAMMYYFCELLSILNPSRYPGDCAQCHPVPATSCSTNLKTIDFKHCYYFDQSSALATKLEEMGSFHFVTLALECSQRNIRLEMVNAAWFTLARLAPHLPASDMGKTVASLVNLHPIVIDYINLENLETLIISTSNSCVGRVIPSGGPRVLGHRPEWPFLKALHLNIDSDSLPATIEAQHNYNVTSMQHHHQAPVARIFQFLFEGPPHENLTEFSINFKEMSRILRIHNSAAENIAMSCRNLSKLELANWTGTNLGITKFWTEMIHLEEVVIRNCKGLGNAAFVGVDKEDPIFLGLKRLKRLSLLDLDKMPKLTDTLFWLVLSRMSLSHLTLSSNAPIPSVTPEGIKSLLNGPFANTIEKFSFLGWSLQNCTPEEFGELSIMFHSSNML